MTVPDMLMEAVNRGVDMRFMASGWLGIEVDADALEFDYDGSLIFNSTYGEPIAITGKLFFRPQRVKVRIRWRHRGLPVF
jgi:hypothetical protein